MKMLFTILVINKNTDQNVIFFNEYRHPIVEKTKIQSYSFKKGSDRVC